MMPQGASVHASAVLVGDRAVLIRGPSGAGKSRLAFDLILAGRAGQLPPAVLVGDDRVHLDTVAGQLWVRPARELAGLIETGASESAARLRIKAFRHVVDLAASDAERLPPPEALSIRLNGVSLPRIPVGIDLTPPLIAAALTTTVVSAPVNLA